MRMQQAKKLIGSVFWQFLPAAWSLACFLNIPLAMLDGINFWQLLPVAWNLAGRIFRLQATCHRQNFDSFNSWTFSKCSLDRLEKSWQFQKTCLDDRVISTIEKSRSCLKTTFQSKKSWSRSRFIKIYQKSCFFSRSRLRVSWFKLFTRSRFLSLLRFLSLKSIKKAW